MTTSNLTNALNNRKLRIDESTVENILGFMHNYTTNVVEIKVSINSGNKTQRFPELMWPWASEIGRTIISLTARYTSSVQLWWHFPLSPLNGGIEKVDVLVSVKNYGCLPTESKGSERVFDFLLDQLSHSDDTHNYKLCRAFNNEKESVKQYNCCRVASGEKRTICAKYLSFAVKSIQYGVLLFGFVILYIGFPLIISDPDDEKVHYEIMDSPLALSTTFYTLYNEGHVSGVIIATIITLTTPPAYLIVLLFSCHIPCMAFDIFVLNENDPELLNRLSVNVYNAHITILTLPLNIKFWWNILTLKFSNYQTRTPKFCYVLVSVICFPFAFIIVSGFNLISSLHVVIYRTLCFGIFTSFKLWKLFVLLLQPIALGVLMCFIVICLFSTFLFTAAIYLNGEFFGPIAVPVIGLVVYLWKYWKFFIEIKYLVLKTNTYEVCKELWENNEAPVQNPEGNLEVFTVNVKDGKILKTLYNKIREKILPYDKVLFYFFARMVFVATFFLILYAMMSSTQKSNISSSAQIISSLIVSTFPLFFDAIWDEGTLVKKYVGNTEQKQMIREIISLKGKTGDTITISMH
ncbi:Hypothetical predicted protein [Paramuricea clavata]|uniref:Uncharacterized protein n=1 Tax=Paramuricea clavata TaxID=317549 RepID=A0A6S7I388_PARCT|nr:Hypothetical predicted protein [Paramuricea clavata]